MIGLNVQGVASGVVMMMAPRESALPHAALIRAVLDGKVVQARYVGEAAWTDLEPVSALKRLVSGVSAWEFRLKPEPVTKDLARRALDKVAEKYRIGSDDALTVVLQFIEEAA